MITTNYLKDFIHSENTNKNKPPDQKYLIQHNSSIPKKNIGNVGNDKINQINNHAVNYNIQNIQSKIVTPSNNPLRNYESTKNFSTKNVNGKKFVFNEKQEKFEGVYRQLNNQASSNNNFVNYNYPNNDKSSNVNKFNKITRENQIPQKSNDKIKNILGNKFLEK